MGKNTLFGQSLCIILVGANRRVLEEEGGGGGERVY